ncbi:AEC family transporter [Pseudomonas guariconensis]|uniref:AEC family transporter n=1 Tax=Pseudomonas TaxID=286 RepID=UPI001CE3FB0E|nr:MULTISPECIES: AEC family transporter [Pseudomonas]MCO7639401.1 AEC family transporter [Pseudomonas sp. S 311-6]MCO7515133.1 AEC family transporter [Pseudomonas putida]MCO7565105.1 AEC family transporter [Pseudomonas mosselii]MCO7593796.1 AEC family transporter [Pseudomonas guariconensis]MCO7605010.1 AEC family transporter [Pseudomonas guariconensis]
MLASLFAVLAPVFIVAGIGYAWARRGLDYPTEFIAGIVMTVGTPSLVLSTLSRTDLDPTAFASMALGCVLCMLGMALAGLLVCRASGQHWRVLLPAFMFPNTGNMGLPISLYAFGEHGLALAVAFFLTLSIFQFTVGLAMSGSAASFKALLRNPIVISLVGAMPIIFLDLELPRWLANTVDLLGGMTIPLMLLTLGVSLASIRLRHVGNGLLLGGLRIVLGAAVGWGVGAALGLEPLERAVLVVQSSMPVAVFNYLLAVRANRSPEQVANLVMCSTVLSFAWLPAVLAWWL